jgi:superfamily II DNA/RNA helicase
MFDFPLNALDYLHRIGRTQRGLSQLRGRVTALVSKRDQVLANAIERAVQRGESLDGLSSRKSDYQPGGRLERLQQPSAATAGKACGKTRISRRPNGSPGPSSRNKPSKKTAGGSSGRRRS